MPSASRVFSILQAAFATKKFLPLERKGRGLRSFPPTTTQLRGANEKKSGRCRQSYQKLTDLSLDELGLNRLQLPSRLVLLGDRTRPSVTSVPPRLLPSILVAGRIRWWWGWYGVCWCTRRYCCTSNAPIRRWCGWCGVCWCTRRYRCTSNAPIRRWCGWYGVCWCSRRYRCTSNAPQSSKNIKKTCSV